MSVEPPLWISRLELPLEPAAVHDARVHTRNTLCEWGCEAAVIDDVLLIVSELATNAVRHTRKPDSTGSGRFVLTLCHLTDALQVYLYDDDPVPPRMRRAADDDTDGRGLLLVGELCDSWGYCYPPLGGGTGKAVMAEVRLGERASGEPVPAREARPMPPLPDADPWTRANILSALREVIKGGPFVYG